MSQKEEEADVEIDGEVLHNKRAKIIDALVETTPIFNNSICDGKLAQSDVHAMFHVLIGVAKDDGSKEASLFRANNLSGAYMWSDQHSVIDSKDLTESDKKFLASRESFQTELFYGMHAYGGYWQFFRPDLNEVINLIHDWWVRVDKPSHVYVQTRPWPNYNARESYSVELDRHRAVTQVWWIK